MNEIIKYKKEHNMTSEDFAKLTGLSAVNIYKLEAHPEELLKCKTSTIAKIAQLIGMSVEDLITSCTGVRL